MLAFLDTYGLMLLIGSWPNGPIGGFAGTLILAGLGILGAFPMGLSVPVRATDHDHFLGLLSIAHLDRHRNPALFHRSCSHHYL